jgi:hypothetical protein
MDKAASFLIITIACLAYGLLWLVVNLLKGVQIFSVFVQEKAGPVLPKLRGVIDGAKPSPKGN